ncbi:zeta toxin family protein [Kribbella sp. NPDC003557]|uniref:zeta toxin family protein n=1 Tax=Kribbella sp. NPDC003557 TaxID=3154449 RepID=UPI0033AB7B7D
MTADPTLTPDEANAVTARRIAQITPLWLPERAAGQRPVLVVIGGQPAAGKSTAQELIRAALDARRVAVYDRDDDPPAHPRFDPIMRANGVDGNLLVAEGLPPNLRDDCLDHLRSRQYDVIASSPLQSEAATRFWVDGFRPENYRIAVVYIATNEANSLLGIANRYQQAKDTVGYGRWLEKELHDRAAAGMPDAAHAAEVQGLVDDLYVVDRDGNVLYENHRGDDGVMPPPHRGRETILGERNRPPTPAEHQWFLGTAVPLLDRAADLEPPVLQLVQTALRLHNERPAPEPLVRGSELRLDQRLADLRRIAGSGVAPPQIGTVAAADARPVGGRVSERRSLDR